MAFVYCTLLPVISATKHLVGPDNAVATRDFIRTLRKTKNPAMLIPESGLNQPPQMLLKSPIPPSGGSTRTLRATESEIHMQPGACHNSPASSATKEFRTGQELKNSSSTPFAQSTLVDKSPRLFRTSPKKARSHPLVTSRKKNKSFSASQAKRAHSENCRAVSPKILKTPTVKISKSNPNGVENMETPALHNSEPIQQIQYPGKRKKLKQKINSAFDAEEAELPLQKKAKPCRRVQAEGLLLVQRVDGLEKSIEADLNSPAGSIAVEDSDDPQVRISPSAKRSTKSRKSTRRQSWSRMQRNIILPRCDPLKGFRPVTRSVTSSGNAFSDWQLDSEFEEIIARHIKDPRKLSQRNGGLSKGQIFKPLDLIATSGPLGIEAVTHIDKPISLEPEKPLPAFPHEMLKIENM